jgi:hypothetical protein
VPSSTLDGSSSTLRSGFCPETSPIKGSDNPPGIVLALTAGLRSRRQTPR